MSEAIGGRVVPGLSERNHIVRKVYVENKPWGKKKKHSGWQCKVRFIGYGPRSDEWY
jgi:hypothetical protein